MPRDLPIDSGILAEQLHPYTGEPVSISPLTWSHAAFVETVLIYTQKFLALSSQAQPPQAREDGKQDQRANKGGPS